MRRRGRLDSEQTVGKPVPGQPGAPVFSSPQSRPTLSRDENVLHQSLGNVAGQALDQSLTACGMSALHPDNNTLLIGTIGEGAAYAAACQAVAIVRMVAIGKHCRQPYGPGLGQFTAEQVLQCAAVNVAWLEAADHSG